MANPLEVRGVRPTSVVPETPKVGPVVPMDEGTQVVGKNPVEQVGDLKPTVEIPVLGARSAAPAAAEVKPTPAPGK